MLFFRRAFRQTTPLLLASTRADEKEDQALFPKGDPPFLSSAGAASVSYKDIGLSKPPPRPTSFRLSSLPH
jgi:hypothetical protein